MRKKTGKSLLFGALLATLAVGIAGWPHAKDSPQNSDSMAPGMAHEGGVSVGAGEPSDPQERSLDPNLGGSFSGKKAFSGKKGRESEKSDPAAEAPNLAVAAESAGRNIEVANSLCDSLIDSVTMGPPLQAKLRIRAWAAGKEVKEVGSYEQAGRGTGWMRMELEVPIADGKGRWQQTCDGRLAWTREELAGIVRVRRVDVGRVAELVRPGAGSLVSETRGESAGAMRLTSPQSAESLVGTIAVDSRRATNPWLRIGGLAELLDRIQAEYHLQVTEGHLDETPMMVLKGQMKEEYVAEIMDGSEGAFPELVPRHVRIAVPANQLDLPMPARIEFWTRVGGTLLSMIEVYDLTEIDPPTVERFRFEPRGDDFTNETDQYLKRFGFQVAEYLEPGASSLRR